MTSDIETAIARTAFVSAYADQHEEASAAGIDTGLNPSGCDWFDLAPDDIDPAAIRYATNLAGRCDLAGLYELAQATIDCEGYGFGDRDLTPDNFGHYIAMQAMGHGVGLADAFGQAVRDAITVPYAEFGGCYLDRAYFGEVSA